MIIEENTNYAYKLKFLQTPTFDKVRNISVGFKRELPKQLQDELYEALNRGVDLLESEPLMVTYLDSYGKMHQAKLNYGFSHLPIEFLSQSEINIIDYGCGQAIGIMCYADYIRDNGYNQQVKSVTLIEPSSICLKRAALHSSIFFPNAKIKTIQKTFDELSHSDIVCEEKSICLHILSNVLDMTNFDLNKFTNLIKDNLKGYNQFVCVGPYFKDAQKDNRLSVFASCISDNAFYETKGKRELNSEKDWTCALSVFSSGHLPAILTKNNYISTTKGNNNGIPLWDWLKGFANKPGKHVMINRLITNRRKDLKDIKSKKIPCTPYRTLRFFTDDNYIDINGCIIGKNEEVVFKIEQNIAQHFGISIEEINKKWIIAHAHDLRIKNDNSSTSGKYYTIALAEKEENLDNNLSTEVTDEDLANSVEDEYGVRYSKDGKRLLKSYILDDESMISYSIKEGTIVICNEAFSTSSSFCLYNHTLETINLPDSIKTIGNSAFFCCRSLKKINIPNSVTNIGDSAFYECESLTQIHIPDSIETIGHSAFCLCKQLQQINIPNTIKALEDCAFMACSSLQSIESKSSRYNVKDGFLIDSFNSKLLTCFGKETQKNVPDSIRTIGHEAFFMCNFLQTIIIPSSIEIIEYYAFSGCEALQLVTLTNSIVSIGENAFLGCKALRQIRIPKGTRKKFINLLDKKLWNCLVEE